MLPNQNVFRSVSAMKLKSRMAWISEKAGRSLIGRLLARAICQIRKMMSIPECIVYPESGKRKKYMKEAAIMIEKYESGRFIRIAGQTYHSDVKIIGGQVKANWWRREGHRLDQTDISDIIENRPDILVIGTGYAGRMQVPESTRSAISNHGIQLMAENTDSAVRIFNRLHKEGRKVAGAFHLTC
jgi:hypothetical protein